MAVSSGLQRHFDKKKAGKKQMQKRFDDLRGQIDPAFLSNFENFRCQVLEIVEENPESCGIVNEEVDALETKLQRVNRKKSVQTFEVVTDNI